MTLAQVQAFVAAFLGLVASLTGLLTTVAVLLPAHTARAHRALDEAPMRSFLHGLAMVAAVAFAFALLNIPLPLIKFAGFCLLLVLTAIATLGAAGLAQLMGRRIGEMSGARTSFGFLVRGSLAYSLGVLCPYIGWLVLGPLSLICILGAGLAALRPAPRALSAGSQSAPGSIA
jgi:hypothetical protein